MPHIPMREDELARPRERKGGNTAPVTHGEMLPVKIPATPKDWHPIAKRLFNSAKTSGQRDFYQNSDWAMLYSLCDDLSRYKHEEDRAARMNARRDEWYELTEDERIERGLNPDVPPPHGGKGGSAMKLTATLNALTGLLITEGDRRRLRLELQQPQEETTPASVAAIDDYRARLGAVK